MSTASLSAIDGLNRAQELMERSVRQIASLTAGLQDPAGAALAADTVDLSAAVIGLIEAQNGYELSLTALDSILGLEEHLLDVLA